MNQIGNQKSLYAKMACNDWKCLFWNELGKKETTKKVHLSDER